MYAVMTKAHITMYVVDYHVRSNDKHIIMFVIDYHVRTNQKHLYCHEHC